KPVSFPQPPAATPPAPTNKQPPFVAPQHQLTERQAERLLWRAGFGPAPGQAAVVATKSLEDVVLGLTRPSGTAHLVGPEPHDDDGYALSPLDASYHDHLFLLDRMVRSDQPLVERMALIFHDWFGVSREGVTTNKQMLDHFALLREKGLGSFRDLLEGVTGNVAMLLFLGGKENTKSNPNENFARELMELFTLGADRGAYTEADVREMARALTGWTVHYTPEAGITDSWFDPTRHDAGSKTIFGHTGTYSWDDALRLCLENPLHPSFFVTKLWSYFVPSPPDDATLAALQGVYLSSGYGIRPVVEAILMHPVFLGGEDMVIPPVVYNAGLLRARSRGIDTEVWGWLSQITGQQLLYPPNVAGWDDTHWLDTATMRGRWMMANYVAMPWAINPWPPAGTTLDYDADESAQAAFDAAVAFWGSPVLSAETRTVIMDFASTCLPSPMASWQVKPYKAMRQNALRMLVASSPDMQVS
ncbi:MAG: hypothetical protein QOJ07_1654, partial [Thermoleophilaceae bacterium]|nr:hypothetical protein [Thermoleophilaceae bacterium]